jgi:BTB/POZ domain
MSSNEDFRQFLSELSEIKEDEGENEAKATLSALFDEPTFSDFTFIVQGKEFKVHRKILGVASPVMMKLFTTDMQEKREAICRVENILPETFEAMLRFVYCKNSSYLVNVDQFLLYEAANYYQIAGLCVHCLKRIKSLLTARNADFVYKFACRFNLVELKTISWKLVEE